MGVNKGTCKWVWIPVDVLALVSVLIQWLHESVPLSKCAWVCLWRWVWLYECATVSMYDTWVWDACVSGFHFKCAYVQVRVCMRAWRCGLHFFEGSQIYLRYVCRQWLVLSPLPYLWALGFGWQRCHQEPGLITIKVALCMELTLLSFSFFSPYILWLFCSS